MVTVSSSTASRSSGFRENLEALRSAQKPARGTAAYSRLVNRPLGRVVAAAGHSVGMTPNQATALSAVLSGTALVLLAMLEPGLLAAVAVPVMLAAGYVMDSVDGQLARLRGGGSRSGEWLDHTIDCFKTVSFHLAVLISFYRFPPLDSDWILLVPVAFEVVDVVTFFGLIMMPLLRPASALRPSQDQPPEHPLRKWVILPTDYGVFCWVFVLLAWPKLFLLAYTILMLVNAAVLVLALRKWWGELRTLDQTS